MAVSVDQGCTLLLHLATDVIAGDQNIWEEQKTSLFSGQLQSGSGVCRGWQQDSAACKTLRMPAGLMLTSWLWCAVICGAAAKMWTRGDVWKGLQTTKVWRHGKGSKKMHWCWDWVRNNKRCLVHLHALQGGMCRGKLVVLQDTFYVAAIHTAGTLQCFQDHGTRRDDLGHQVLFPAIAGLLSFNPYCKLIDLYLKGNQGSSPHNTHCEAVLEFPLPDG